MQARREMQYVRKQLDSYHRWIGETVLWAAYNPANSWSDPTYNDPGFRSYFQPVNVQTLWINRSEGGKRIDDERYDKRNNLTIAISAEAFRNAGVPDIFDDKTRIFDLFKYWDHSWSVIDYEIMGRLPQRDSTILGIQAVEVDVGGDYPFEYPQQLLDNQPEPTLLTPSTGMGYTDTETFAKQGVLSPVTGQLRWYAQENYLIREIIASVGSAPVGRDLVLDVLRNGISVLTAEKLVIPEGANTGRGTLKDTALNDGQYVTINILQVGTTHSGADLTVEVQVSR